MDTLFEAKAVHGLMEEIQSLLVPHGVEAKTVLAAFNETLLEISSNKTRKDAEELRSYMLGTIAWKIFAPGSTLWIHSQTKSGNDVPLDLLVAAYSVWRNALHLAAKRGLDSAAAAEALAQVTYATADRILRGCQNSGIGPVRDPSSYMVGAFMNLISRIAAKQGLKHTNYVDMGELLAKWEFSDQGAFMDALENGILCRELLNAMPPKAKSVAIARYVLGYNWKETAASLNTSVNTAQKALSSGIRKAFGLCMRELQTIGFEKIAETEVRMMEKKKARSRRKSRERYVQRK